jgi:hypothetical protein
MQALSKMLTRCCLALGAEKTVDDRSEAKTYIVASVRGHVARLRVKRLEVWDQRGLHRHAALVDDVPARRAQASG